MERRRIEGQHDGWQGKPCKAPDDTEYRKGWIEGRGGLRRKNEIRSGVIPLANQGTAPYPAEARNGL